MGNVVEVEFEVVGRNGLGLGELGVNGGFENGEARKEGGGGL